MKAGLTLGLALGWFALAGVQTPPGRTRSVEVLIGVATSFGTPVNDLEVDAFAVEVDGRHTAIDRVRQVAEPLSLTLLVDVSGSMFALRWVETRVDKTRPGWMMPRPGGNQMPPVTWELLQRAVVSGLFLGVQPIDRVRLAGLRTTTWISPPLEHTREAYERAFSQLVEHGRDPATVATRSSPLWDAISLVLNAKEAEPQGRRLIVVISDGRVNANRLSPEELAERAVNADVAVAFVDEGQAVLMDKDGVKTAIRPDHAFRWVAEATGGAYLPDTVLRGALDAANPALLVERAIEGHRRAYTMTLTVPADDRAHTLKVAVKREGLMVRAPAFIRR